MHIKFYTIRSSSYGIYKHAFNQMLGVSLKFKNLQIVLTKNVRILFMFPKKKVGVATKMKKGFPWWSSG